MQHCISIGIILPGAGCGPAWGLPFPEPAGTLAVYLLNIAGARQYRYDSLVQAEIKDNSHRHARHDTDRTVLSCLAWRCELSRPDRRTGGLCVWSVSECVGRRSATAGRTPTQNAFVGR